MSPYLFVLIMEYLARKLRGDFTGNSFKFHPKCNKEKIFHIAFAYDLLLFSHGDLKSIKFLKNALDDFARSSGLKMNLSKSKVFFGGINDDLKLKIQCLLGCSEGKLPMKYLGVPLCSRRLRVEDYNPLILKMTGKLHSWRSKNLSYAGRVQLTRLVLKGIQNFWSLILPLPQTVIHKVDSICRSYIWTVEANKRKSLISWEVVCSSKDVGGLDIKRSSLWAKACLIKYWFDIDKGRVNSLWIKWAKSNKVKNMNLRNLRVKQCDSWWWKKLLVCYSEVEEQVSFETLSNISALHRKSRLQETYRALLPQPEEIQWKEIVWNEVACPKAKFISWLAFHRRLTTKDRLKRMNLIEEGTCNICNREDESFQHLFFRCEFSANLLKEGMKIAGYTIAGDFNQIQRIFELSTMKSSNTFKVRAEILCEVISEIWSARNLLQFENKRPNLDASSINIAWRLKVRLQIIKAMNRFMNQSIERNVLMCRQGSSLP